MRASLVKYKTKKMLWYIKTIFFLVNRLKVIEKCCLNGIFL